VARETITILMSSTVGLTNSLCNKLCNKSIILSVLPPNHFRSVVPGLHLEVDSES